MAIFTNYATLSYSGGTSNSNTVTGEIRETLSAVKTAVRTTYSSGDRIAYVISLTNSGTASFTGLTVTDDLGGISSDTSTLYPLNYVDGSVLYYVNGILQTTPTVTAGPPLTISGINIPAGGNAVIVYEADITSYAPLSADSEITNTATISGAGVTSTVTASETISTVDSAALSITKALTPTVVTENGQITYTFTILNTGNTAATAEDNVTLTDTFDPVLSSITVLYNGDTWPEAQNYTYNTTSGVFTTLPGRITVPAATYTQNADGTWTVSPGITTLSISGTV